jgi:rhamnose utilization protein RhaD (predicted bifunctional aldolase and dehydrogenase)
MKNFIIASRELGKDKLNFQGAGGNSSVKIGNKIFIKSSGYRMKDISMDNGISVCSYLPLKKFLSFKKKYSTHDEEKFLKIINQARDKSSKNNPSMEIGFHAILNSKFIFHLHNIYANIFLCMEEGEKDIKKIFNDYDFKVIPYFNPGYELAHFLSKNNNLPRILFLKNHGIIVHGNNLNECIGTIFMINSKIKNYLDDQNSLTEFKIINKDKRIIKYLFPDAAVFSKTKLSKLNSQKTKDILEIKSTQVYILNEIKKQKRKPRYLSNSQVKKIINMQQEKERLEK